MKSQFTSILAFLLSTVILLSALSGCSGGLNKNYGGTSADGSSNDTLGATDDVGNSTDGNDESDEPDASGTITLYSNRAYRAKFIVSDTARDFNKSYFTQACNLFKKITVKAPEVDTDKATLDGPAILIGETALEESKEVYKTLQKNQAKAVLLGNKYVIAYSSELAAAELYEELRALLNKYATKDKIVIDSNWNITVTAKDASTAIVGGSNKVMACDQKNKRIVIYDFNKYTQTSSLDSMEVRVLNVGHTTDVKYREGTVFGDVLVIMGDAASANSGIYNYASGKALWTTKNPGANPHSIEILPSGNIVIASTSDNKIRLFKTSALQNNDKTTANQYTDYTLEDAHGVLWDPTYKVLWALGRYELRAYAIQSSGTNEKLVEVTQMRINLPEGHRGGHDLSPDYTNTRYLYITVGEFALKIDKKERAIIADYEYYKLMNAQNIKGFSNNPYGNFFITGEIGTTSFASWCTNYIYFCRYNGSTYEKIKLTSSKSAFYKARSFCGTYQ